MGKLNDTDKIKVIELYKNGEKTKDIARLFNVTSPAISGIIRRRKLKTRPKSRKFMLKEDIFDLIDSQDKAYWLGFIMGDGSITANLNTLKIELSSKDSKHLEKFILFLQSNYIIKTTRKDCCIVEVHSKYLCKKLINYGIIPRKTYTKIKTPNIDKNLLVHFYRGLFDADGWITEHKIKNKKIQHEFGFSSYYEDILLEIKIWISENISKKVGYIKTRIRNNQQVSQLIIGGNKNFIGLGNLFYKNSSIYLDRKFQKYQDFLKQMS